MPGSRLTSKAGTILSLPICLLLVIFFFLPWLNITCAGNKVASSSGLQISTGKISMAPMFAGSPAAPGSPSAGPGAQKDPQARPWFFLALAIPLAVLVLGALCVVGRVAPRKANHATWVLGLVGFFVLAMALDVDYGSEMTSTGMNPPPANSSAGSESDQAAEAMAKSMGDQMARQLEKQIKTEAAPFLVVSLVLAGLLACCPLLNLLAPKLLAGLAPVQTAPVSTPPPPPPDGSE
jgi:hypothetical protein